MMQRPFTTTLRSSAIRCRAHFATKNASDNRLRVLVAESHDAVLNLATEEWLFRDADIGKQTLFLWRNDKSVIIGRNQNVWKECHVSFLNDLNIRLARRGSGGGAVYQDLGNTCFTFLSPMEAYDKSRNMQILVDALGKLGVEAKASGRNDILVNNRKVSGSAYKQNSQRAFHHGTLLVDVDGAIMEKVLNPSKEKLKSKGVTSVQQRVLNMKSEFPQVSHESLSNEIINQFLNVYKGKADIETLDTAKVNSEPALMRYYEQLESWDWRFGNNPQFSHHFETRFDWGTVDVHVEVHKSVVTDAVVFSDALRANLPSLLRLALVGVRYDNDGIDLALRRTAMLLAENVASDYLEEGAASPAAVAAIDAAAQSRSFDECLALLPAVEHAPLRDLREWLSSSL